MCLTVLTHFCGVQVNAAVDDAATMAEGVAHMLATARARGKMATHDRKRAQMLMVNVAVFSFPLRWTQHLNSSTYHRKPYGTYPSGDVEVTLQGKEGVKGHHWFMEQDTKSANILRPDKTGKSLLTVLRHLGRLHEVTTTLAVF